MATTIPTTAASVQDEINQRYASLTRPADKAAFVRRLKDASLPMPQKVSKTSVADSYIAGLVSKMQAEQATAKKA